MIFDQFENRHLYATNEAFAKAFAFLEDYIANPKAPGRYDIDGDNIYASISAYDTKAEGMMEAHDKYIDIQFLDGECEKIEYVYREGLTVKVPYVDDIVFFEDCDCHSSLILRNHSFVVLYPQDAHKPGLAAGKSVPVKKIVIKIKVDCI